MAMYRRTVTFRVAAAMPAVRSIGPVRAMVFAI